MSYRLSIRPLHTWGARDYHGVNKIEPCLNKGIDPTVPLSMLHQRLVSMGFGSRNGLLVRILDFIPSETGKYYSVHLDNVHMSTASLIKRAKVRSAHICTTSRKCFVCVYSSEHGIGLSCCTVTFCCFAVCGLIHDTLIFKTRQD